MSDSHVCTGPPAETVHLSSMPACLIAYLTALLRCFKGTSNAMWPKQMSCVPLEYLFFSQHFLSVSDSTNHPITQGTDSWDILNVFLCFIPKSSPSPVLLDFIFWVPYQSTYFHPHPLPPLSLTFPVSHLNFAVTSEFPVFCLFLMDFACCTRVIFSKCKTYHALYLALVHGFPLL